MSLELQWGLPPPPTATVAWGARAIYQLRHYAENYTRRVHGRVQRYTRDKTIADIDIPFDRQCAVGDDKERKALRRFINKKAIKKIQKLCIERYITQDSETLITVALDGYIIEASPRASYGYLYICVSKA
jgi:hypothetical protein